MPSKPPKYTEVASGFLGAGIEKLASRGAQELDKSKGWEINDPVKRSQTWVDWLSAIGSAVALLTLSDKLDRHPKAREFVSGWGHGAVANAGNTIEETVTGIAPYKPIPRYAQKTITTPNSSAGINIKAIRQPGIVDIQSFKPLVLS